MPYIRHAYSHYNHVGRTGAGATVYGVGSCYGVSVSSVKEKNFNKRIGREKALSRATIAVDYFHIKEGELPPGSVVVVVPNLGKRAKKNGYYHAVMTNLLNDILKKTSSVIVLTERVAIDKCVGAPPKPEMLA